MEPDSSSALDYRASFLLAVFLWDHFVIDSVE